MKISMLYVMNIMYIELWHFHHRVQTGSGAHPTSYARGYQVLFPWG